MRLSIIIPVYNVEAYVGKTLASVFDTTAPAEDFEVIVVNDGTEDKSMDVVRQFADRPNLTVIEQENQGLGAARMKGLSVATGEYVWFVDSDDWLVEDGVGKVLNLLAGRPGAEVMRFPLMWVREDGTMDLNKENLLEKEVVVNGRTLVRDLRLDVVGAQRFVMLRSLFSDSRLFFPQGLLFEDGYFSAVLITIVRQFHVIPDIVYFYRVREGSIMMSLDVSSCYDKVSIHKMVERFRNQAVDPVDRPWFDRYYFSRLLFAYSRMMPFFHTPEFRKFARSQGFYVWTQWMRISPDASWKTKLKFLRGFLFPDYLPALLGWNK